MDTNNTTALPDFQSTKPSQHLASLGAQFLLCCCVGGVGGFYCLRSLRKVTASQKVLKKYTTIPNLLVACLLTCGLIIPLRMFATMMLLADDNVFAFCLVIFYIEFLCDTTVSACMIALALQRLKGMLRHRFTTTSPSLQRIRPSCALVALTWFGPAIIASYYTYVCVTSPVPPWTLATCTHDFFPTDAADQTFKRPRGMAVVVDLTLPLITTLTFVIIAVAYTVIVRQIWRKTCMIHPSPPHTVSTNSMATDIQRKHRSVQSQQRSTISSKSGKTVSWSSIATNGPRFSEILQMARQNRNSRRGQQLGKRSQSMPQTRKLSMSALQDDEKQAEQPSSQRRASCQENVQSQSSLPANGALGKRNDMTGSTTNAPTRELARRRSSALSLVQVSTIPEMRSEEDEMGRHMTESKLKGSEALISAPVARKHLPPVTLPEKHTRSLKKKKKKWSRSSQKRRYQYAKERYETMTSQDSEISQWSGENVIQKSSRFCLRRQNAVYDNIQPQKPQVENDGKERRSDVIEGSEELRTTRHHSLIPVKPLQPRDSLDTFVDLICPRKSHSLPGKSSADIEDVSDSSQHSFSSCTSDITSSRRAQSWDTGSHQKQSSLEIYYLPNKDPKQPQIKKAQSFDDITNMEEENPHAPQIRIIRPSTETIKLAGPGGRRAPMLGSGRRKHWAPMTTISSNSESEFDMFGGTSLAGTRYSSDACSESNGPQSPCSRHGSDISSVSGMVSGSLWAQRRSTLRRHPASLNSRQFSLASIWSNLPRRHSSNAENSTGFVQELSASFVLRRSLLIVGTFFVTNFPLCVLHMCLYCTPPSVIVNIYPLFKLWQQTYMALSPYIYVFSNQKIHMELLKTENDV